MKKHFLAIILIISVFILLPHNANASFGDLRYEITEFYANNQKITIKGWAFIHKTNNYVTVYKNNKTTDGTVKTNGGQKVKISAYLNEEHIETIENTVTRGKSGWKDYNFYSQQFYKFNYYYNPSNTNGLQHQIDYYNGNFSYYNNGKNNKDGTSIGEGNTCKNEDGKSQCYYQDVYFSITFDLTKEKWVNKLTDEKEMKFKIAVTNNFYNNKCKNTTCKGATYEYENDKWWKKEDMSIMNTAKIETDSNYIKEVSPSITANFIASSAVLKESDGATFDANTNPYGNTYSSYGFNNPGDQENSCAAVYANDNTAYYLTGGTALTNTTFLGGLTGGIVGIRVSTYNTKYKAIKDEKGRTKDYYYFRCPCSGSNCSTAYAYSTWLKPKGTFSMKIVAPKKCSESDPPNKTLKCNGSLKLESKCNELTVTGTKNSKNASAVVAINETGTITNILTPKTIFAGGGIKTGIMYYNELTWTIKPGTMNCKRTDNGGTCDGRDVINDQMSGEENGRIKKINDFINTLKIETAQFGDDTIADSKFIKKCEQKTTTAGDTTTLTTICTIFLPKSELDEYTGKVTYGSGVDKGINNKYYTPINKSGVYPIFMKITGLNRLKDDSLKKDSKTTKEWTGIWNINTANDGTCNVNLYNKMNKFIYRPIDIGINKAFPNRNPGVNWYTWYSDENNKRRLANSYSDLDYKIELDNTVINNIKNYNKTKNYLDWDNINAANGESKFIRKDFNRYFCKIDGVGDCQ